MMRLNEGRAVRRKGREGEEELRGKLTVTVTTDAAQHGVGEQSWRGLVSGSEAHLMHERTK